MQEESQILSEAKQNKRKAVFSCLFDVERGIDGKYVKKEDFGSRQHYVV